jgi:hypothetical protein
VEGFCPNTLGNHHSTASPPAVLQHSLFLKEQPQTIHFIMSVVHFLSWHDPKIQEQRHIDTKWMQVQSLMLVENQFILLENCICKHTEIEQWPQSLTCNSPQGVEAVQGTIAAPERLLWSRLSPQGQSSCWGDGRPFHQTNANPVLRNTCGEFWLTPYCSESCTKAQAHGPKFSAILFASPLPRHQTRKPAVAWHRAWASPQIGLWVAS